MRLEEKQRAARKAREKKKEDWKPLYVLMIRIRCNNIPISIAGLTCIMIQTQLPLIMLLMENIGMLKYPEIILLVQISINSISVIPIALLLLWRHSYYAHFIHMYYTCTLFIRNHM